VDIAGVARQLEERDIALVVDGAQLAAHAVIDVQQLGCDFLVCSAHKFYGPTGIGLVYGRQAALAQLPPWQGGGEIILQVTLSHSDYAQAPHRFEAGTASLAAIAGLEACLDWLATLDRAGLAQHEQALCQALHRQLATLSTIKLLSEPEHNLGIASFVTTGGLAANDLAHWLDQQDIALRVGHHCAQPLIDSLGVGATLRASVAGYNSMEDIERLVAAIASAPSETTQRQQTTSDHWQADDLSALQWQDLAAHNPWQQRYRQLMRWGDSISEKPGLRCSEHRVDGCESPAWLACRIEGNGEDARCYFSVDSESRIVRGLAALMLVLIDGKTAAQIAAIDWQQAFAELGLEQHLSPSRSNGLWALVKRAQQLASKA
jgi:sulfur transfer protein SufE